MVKENREIKVPVSLDTKKAQKDMGLFQNFMGKKIAGIRTLATGVAAGGIAGAAAGGQLFLRGFADPTRSYSSQLPEAGASATEGAFTAAGATVGGIPGAVIGNVVGKLAAALVERVTAEMKFVEGTSGDQVRGIASQFAVAGVDVKDSELKQLFGLFRDQNKRVFDTLRQVARVQDETAPGHGGDVSRAFRSMTSAVSRRTIGQ